MRCCNFSPRTVQRWRWAIPAVICILGLPSLIFPQLCAELLDAIALHKLIPPGLHRWLEDRFSTASAYYEEQRPLFEAAATGYHLYWPFAQTAGIDSLELTFEQLVQLRLRSWAQLMRNFKRDDFRVEKDKCEMYRFFQRNAFPHPALLQLWDDPEALTRDVNSGAAFERAKEWPVFLKACHLTQALNGVMKLKSPAWVAEHSVQLAAWVKAKWAYRADDSKRPWREDGNVLTDTLVPGFFVQASATPSFDAVGRAWEMYELKVEVIWGRAYTAVLCTPQPTREVFLRGSGEDHAEFHRSVGYQSLAMLHRQLPAWRLPGYARWLLAEGHFACVWGLAERVARVLRIDQVRVDIFVTAGNATGCMVNEISLSSGLVVPAHVRYAAKVWAAGHLEHLYLPLGNATSKPAYERTRQDFPGAGRSSKRLPDVSRSAWGSFWRLAAGLAALGSCWAAAACCRLRRGRKVHR